MDTMSHAAWMMPRGEGQDEPPAQGGRAQAWPTVQNAVPMQQKLVPKPVPALGFSSLLPPPSSSPGMHNGKWEGRLGVGEGRVAWWEALLSKPKLPALPGEVFHCSALPTKNLSHPKKKHVTRYLIGRNVQSQKRKRKQNKPKQNKNGKWQWCVVPVQKFFLYIDIGRHRTKIKC